MNLLDELGMGLTIHLGTKHHLRDVDCLQNSLGHIYLGRDLNHRFRDHSL